MNRFDHLCGECGGFGQVNMGPVNRGGPAVWETCYVCHGDYYQTWLKLDTLKREEERQRNDNRQKTNNGRRFFGGTDGIHSPEENNG